MKLVDLSLPLSHLPYIIEENRWYYQQYTPNAEVCQSVCMRTKHKVITISIKDTEEHSCQRSHQCLRESLDKINRVV